MMEGTTCTTIPTQMMETGLLHEGCEEPGISFSISSDQFQAEEESILEAMAHPPESELAHDPLEVGGLEVGNETLVMEGNCLKLEMPLEPSLGMEFESAEAARAFYSAYAERVGFHVRNSKSFTSRVDETVIMRRFVCSKQGRPTKKDPFDLTKKRRNRVSSREGCKAMFQVNRRENGRWTVSRCELEHCHDLGIVQKPSAATLKRLAKKPWELIVGPSIAEASQSGLGTGGGGVQSLLEYFKRMQADNPAFFYALQLDKNNCISNVFWADAKARMAYNYFGDTVTFDTNCKVNKRAVPFAAFTGVNHHRQLIVFGCAFMIDESEASLTWLFETWSTLMNGRCPISIITNLDAAMETSASKVFPNVFHRFCKRDIFHKCKVKLSDLYSKNPTFKGEFKDIINESETVELFEMGWRQLLEKYCLENDAWLQQLYDIRQKWVPVFIRTSFFAEISKEKVETIHKFFQRHSITTTSLRDIVSQFDRAMANQYENELQADSAATSDRPVLQTPSPLEKQASDIYTRTVFDIFQEEFVHSSSFLVEKIEDGLLTKFRVMKVDGNNVIHIVTYNPSETILSCSCYKFEYAGILCGHVLGVCLLVGIVNLPENYILRRWTRNAKNNCLSYELGAVTPYNCHKALSWRCNDLCLDVIRYAEEGATSPAIFKVARDALEKAFTEVLASKKYLRGTWPGKPPHD